MLDSEKLVQGKVCTTPLGSVSEKAPKTPVFDPIRIEPASAASVAGLRKLINLGVADKDERVVCICTGNGLKDPNAIIDNCAPPIKCGNSVEDVERILSQ